MAQMRTENLSGVLTSEIQHKLKNSLTSQSFQAHYQDDWIVSESDRTGNNPHRIPYALQLDIPKDALIY